MKINIDRKNLSKILKKMSGVLARNKGLPILSCVLFEVRENEKKDGKKLTVTATNLDQTLQISTPINSEECGEFVINCPILLRICNGNCCETIGFETKKNSTTVIANTTYEIPLLPPAEFPRLQHEEKKQIAKIENVSEFFTNLDISRKFSSKDETRYILNGVKIEHLEEESFLIATDGKRLAQFPIPKMDLMGVIIPSLSCIQAKSAFDDEENVEIFITTTEKSVIFSSANIYYQSVIIPGNFPDWRRVFPPALSKKITFNPAILQSTIHRLANISTDKNPTAIFSNSTDGLMIRVDGSAAEEQAEEKIEIKIQEPFEFAINAKFFLEGMESIGDGAPNEEMAMHINDDSQPLILQSGAKKILIMKLRHTPKF